MPARDLAHGSPSRTSPLEILQLSGLFGLLSTPSLTAAYPPGARTGESAEFGEIRGGLRSRCRLSIHSFKYPVGRQQDRLGHLEAERLCGLEIDNEIELGWLLDRQIARICPVEIFVHVRSRATDIV